MLPKTHLLAGIQNTKKSSKSNQKEQEEQKEEETQAQVFQGTQEESILHQVNKIMKK